MIRKIVTAGLIATCAWKTYAEVVLPAIFSDNMVVQQKSEARFHGMATPGSSVRIESGWMNNPVDVKTDAAGCWKASIATPKGSRRSYAVKFTDGYDGKETVLHNVAIGEVWLCSGQSNMEMPVAGDWAKVKDFGEELEKARNYPELRLLQIKRHTKMEPQREAVITKGGWQVSSPESTADFSAIANFFGRIINGELKVPVGVIDCTWGGSPIEAWISCATLSKCNGFEGVVKDYAAEGMDEGAIRAHYKALADSANAGRHPLPAIHSDAYAHKSGFPGTIDGHTFYPCELYNAMLLPLSAIDIRGVLWYQGENNGDRGEQYECLFPAMINEWRQLWDKPSMPFYFVQLANWRKRKEVEPHSEWGRLREAQASALRLNDTGMAVAIDIGDADDIHPRNKQEVARRLALLALNRTYGRKVVCGAPEFRNCTVEGNKCFLTFTVPAGEFAPEGNLSGFIVAGSDGRFYKADAWRAGDRIVVNAPEVDVPVAVRYAWADNPEVSLYGKNGLPVAPFRTDRW